MDIVVGNFFMYAFCKCRRGIETRAINGVQLHIAHTYQERSSLSAKFLLSVWFFFFFFIHLQGHEKICCYIMWKSY